MNLPINDNPEAQRGLALLSWLQQSAPYGVLTLDLELRVQSWNSWMETHSALPGPKVIGRPLLEIFPELENRKLAAPFHRALAGESSVLATALHRHLLPLKSPSSKDAKELMRQTARINPLLSGGVVCGVLVVIEDVTQREVQSGILARQHRNDEVLSWALLQLLKSEEPRNSVRPLFFKIAEHLDFDTFFLYLRDENSGEVKLYTEGGVSDSLRTRFEDYELLAAATDSRQPVILDGVMHSDNPDYALLKEAKIASAIAIPLRVQNTRLGALCFASWNRDRISSDETELLTTVAQYLAAAVDKENTHNELRRIEAVNRWMAAIVESSHDAIISKDLDGIIKSCNEGAARLFGYQVSELVGQPMRMLVPDDLQSEESRILEQIRKGESLLHFETVRKQKNGSLIAVSLMVSPVMDEAGKVIGASNIARDITERKNTERTLAESFLREKLAREKAENANRAKDDFLASLSHELRTPLNPILLIASDASDNDSLPAEVRAQFETIRKNIELEAKLIDDLLDMTRITHGKLSLHLRPVNLKAVLDDTVRNVRSEIDDKLIAFEFRVQTPQTHVLGDEVRLQQVFWNILKNAVKFTPKSGRVSLTLAVHEGSLRIAVADNGIGISKNELDNIFDAFAQGEHAKGGAHRFGGLGLGLAIARKLVEMHGGTIAAHSEGANKGSTFVIELPAAGVETIPVPSPAQLLLPPASSSTAPAICILLVEDHEPTRLTLSRLLTRRGYKIITASSAQEARDAAKTEKIDLVISDIGLPDSSGNDLMKSLHADFGLTGIALTGYGMEEDIERCLASGFATHLIKPVNIRALENALAAFFKRE